MQIQGNVNQAIDAFKQNSVQKNEVNPKANENANKESKSVEEIVNDSATKVTISMNAQYILFEMNAAKMAKDNTFGQLNATKVQQNVLDFLNGDAKIDNMSLADIGYKGKPIMQLSQDEAKELVSDDGFFGVIQTSERVANFVFSFAGNDLDILQKGRDGVVQGFEEAKKLFGGELPEISYKTQERTLSLIDERINSIKESMKAQEEPQE